MPGVRIEHSTHTTTGGYVNLVVANYSAHAIRKAIVRWHSVEGYEGDAALGPLGGADVRAPGLAFGPRSSEYHPIQISSEMEPMDTVEVSLDYWGMTGPTGWRITQVFTDTGHGTDDPQWQRHTLKSSEELEVELG